MSRVRSSRSMIYRLTLNAMFVAIHVILGLVPSEFSLQSLPVLVCAFLLSPADAIAVSFLGSFIEQLRWGLGITTVFWVLPWLVFGLVAGVGAYLIRRRERPWKMILVIVLSELVLNIGNTVALVSLGFVALNMTSPWLFLLGFLSRMPQALLRAVLSSILIPLLLPPVRRALAKARLSSTNDRR